MYLRPCDTWYRICTSSCSEKCPPVRLCSSTYSAKLPPEISNNRYACHHFWQILAKVSFFWILQLNNCVDIINSFYQVLHSNECHAPRAPYGSWWPWPLTMWPLKLVWRSMHLGRLEAVGGRTSVTLSKWILWQIDQKQYKTRTI